MNSNVIRRFAVGAALVGLAVGIGIAAAVGRIQSPRARVPDRFPKPVALQRLRRDEKECHQDRASDDNQCRFDATGLTKERPGHPVQSQPMREGMTGNAPRWRAAG